MSDAPATATPARRLLLSAVPRHRAPSARPRWPSGCAGCGHDVTVLTTSAYGRLDTDDDEGVVRTADRSGWRARLAGQRPRRRAVRLRHLQRRARTRSARWWSPSRSWSPGRRSRARAALQLQRERRFDCVITTSPPESVHVVGRALRRRGVPWVADIRDGWTFEPIAPRVPDRALQRRLDERLERRWLGAADAVVCVAEPAAEDLRERRDRRPRCWSRTDGTPICPPTPRPPTPRRPARPRADVARLHRPLRQLRPRSRPAGRGAAPSSRRERPGRGGQARARDRRAADRGRGGARARPTSRRRESWSPAASSASRRAGAAARGRCAAPARPAAALQLLNIKLFEYLAAARPILALAAGTEAGRIVAEAGGRGRPGRRPGGDRRGRCCASWPVTSPPPDPEARERYSYPTVAERMAAVAQGATSRPL